MQENYFIGPCGRLPEVPSKPKAWPKISIVTPSHNQGQLIEETIRSVLSQEYPNLEYIIIDGASTDNSVEIIKKYEQHLAYWVSEPDEGHAHALNKGFSRATGEIMAWINSDDKYLPWTFSVVAEVFNTHKDIEWITGYHSLWDIYGRQVKALAVYKNIYDFLLGRYDWIQQESVFWRRSLWEKAGGAINEKYKFQIDCELWCRFFTFAELWHVDCIIGGYRVYDRNRTSLHSKEVNAEIKAALSELKQRCPVAVKKKLKKIKRLKGLKKTLGFLKIEDICRHLFKDINYKSIVFQNNHWVKKTRKFTL